MNTSKPHEDRGFHDPEGGADGCPGLDRLKGDKK